MAEKTWEEILAEIREQERIKAQLELQQNPPSDWAQGLPAEQQTPQLPQRSLVENIFRFPGELVQDVGRGIFPGAANAADIETMKAQSGMNANTINSRQVASNTFNQDFKNLLDMANQTSDIEERQRIISQGLAPLVKRAYNQNLNISQQNINPNPMTTAEKLNAATIASNLYGQGAKREDVASWSQNIGRGGAGLVDVPVAQDVKSFAPVEGPGGEYLFPTVAPGGKFNMAPTGVKKPPKIEIRKIGDFDAFVNLDDQTFETIPESLSKNEIFKTKLDAIKTMKDIAGAEGVSEEFRKKAVGEIRSMTEKLAQMAEAQQVADDEINQIMSPQPQSDVMANFNQRPSIETGPEVEGFDKNLKFTKSPDYISSRVEELTGLKYKQPIYESHTADTLRSEFGDDVMGAATGPNAFVIADKYRKDMARIDPTIIHEAIHSILTQNGIELSEDELENVTEDTTRWFAAGNRGPSPSMKTLLGRQPPQQPDAFQGIPIDNAPDNAGPTVQPIAQEPTRFEDLVGEGKTQVAKPSYEQDLIKKSIADRVYNSDISKVTPQDELEYTNQLKLSGKGMPSDEDLDLTAEAISEYKGDLNSLSRIGGLRERVFAKAKRLNPNFDQKKYKTYQNIINDYSYGNRSRNITALNTAILHIGQLDKAVDALNNGDLPILNAIAVGFGRETGATAPDAYETIRTAVADEMATALKGQAGTDVGVAKVLATMKTKSTKGQQKVVDKTNLEVLYKRLQEQNMNYKKITGKEFPVFDELTTPVIKSILGIDVPASQRGVFEQGMNLPEGVRDLTGLEAELRKRGLIK